MDLSTSGSYPPWSTSPNNEAMTTTSLQSAKQPRPLNASDLFCPLPDDADLGADDNLQLLVMGDERYSCYRSVIAATQMILHDKSIADTQTSKEGILHTQLMQGLMFINEAAPNPFEFAQAYDHDDFPELRKEHLQEIQAGLAAVESFQGLCESSKESTSLALVLACQAYIKAEACKYEAEFHDAMASRNIHCASLLLTEAVRQRESQRRFEETADTYLKYAQDSQTVDLPTSFKSDCDTLVKRVKELQERFRVVSDAFATQQAPNEVRATLAAHAMSANSNLYMDENTLKAIHAAREKRAGRTRSSGPSGSRGSQSGFSLLAARGGGGVKKNTRGRMTRR